MRNLMKRLNESLMKKPYENLYVSLLIYITDYLIGLAFLGLPNWASLLGLSNWALVCGLEWDQKGPIRH